MRGHNLINFLSVFLISISLCAWYYLLPRFLYGEEDLIQVEGVRTEKSRNIQSDLSEKQLKKNSTSGELYVVEFDTPQKNKDAGGTYVRAGSSIAIDADTGTILHYQEGKKKMAIASLTKIMTALIVIERIEELDAEIIVVDEEAFFTEGTKVGCPRTGYCVSTRLQIGEKISARALLDAMLMNSANDAAVALGKHIAGSQADFAKMMNDKAKQLGLNDTNFCNPSGLDDEDNPGACYSTTYDFARITAHSLKYDAIWEPMRIKEKEIFSVDGQYIHRLVNTDVLLEQLPGCIGGKTGFTYEAGKSLMMTAHHPDDHNKKVVAVLLDDNYRWEDMKILFDWVFSSYVWPK